MRALLAGISFLTVSLAPSASGQSPDPARDQQRIRQQRAEVAGQLDALRATDAEVEGALTDLATNVASQQTLLANAEAAVSGAQAEIDRLAAEEAATLLRIAELRRGIGRAAIDAFMGSESGRPELPSGLESLDDAARHDTLADVVISDLGEMDDELGARREDLEVLRGEAERARTRAESERRDVAIRVDELEAAEAEQQRVAAEVDARIEGALSEAANLDQLDRSLSQQIVAEQQRLAAIAAEQQRRATAAAAAARQAPPRVAAAAPASNRGLSRAAPSGGGRVALTTVAGFTVNASIADQLGAMLSAASAAGINLGGGGYRDPTAQQQLRNANCPDPANSPPSACSPPTARVGQSMHESGLAIDFTANGSLIQSRDSEGFRWLAANAGSYGFSNLPSEPWHWSTNGE